MVIFNQHDMDLKSPWLLEADMAHFQVQLSFSSWNRHIEGQLTEREQMVPTVISTSNPYNGTKIKRPHTKPSRQRNKVHHIGLKVKSFEVKASNEQALKSFNIRLKNTWESEIRWGEDLLNLIFLSIYMKDNWWRIQSLGQYSIFQLTDQEKMETKSCQHIWACQNISLQWQSL